MVWSNSHKNKLCVFYKSVFIEVQYNKYNKYFTRVNYVFFTNIFAVRKHFLSKVNTCA